MKRLWFLIATLPAALCGIEQAPWFGTAFEFDRYLNADFYVFESVEGDGRSLHYCHLNQFYTAGLLFPFEYPLGDAWSIEAEATMANTQRQHFAVDHFSLTARYQWFNDLVGDPISLVTGINLSQAFTHSLRDISSFHHGKAEIEAHVSAGKELCSEQYWISRCWGLAAFGWGDHGSPWVRAHCEWDNNWCETHFTSFFIEGLWGLGGNQLHHLDHFRGYGSINHQSVDVGFKYYYQTECDSIVGLSYAYRVFARNFPQNSQYITLSIDYPFGINDLW